MSRRGVWVAHGVFFLSGMVLTPLLQYEVLWGSNVPENFFAALAQYCGMACILLFECWRYHRARRTLCGECEQVTPPTRECGYSEGGAMEWGARSYVIASGMGMSRSCGGIVRPSRPRVAVECQRVGSC